MRIKEIRIKPLFCKFKQPYVWAQGIHHGANIALIEVETDDGVIGLGESCPTMMPIIPIISFLETIKSILIGEPIFNISNLMSKIYTQNFGIASASHASPRVANQIFAGVELALWDALGKSVNLSVHNLLGGKIQEEISYFGFVQGHTAEELAQHAKQLAGEGFDILYLKVGRSNEEDFKNTEAIRSAIGDRRLRIDANEAWSALEAELMVNKLAKFNLEMIEQPVPALCGADALMALKQSSPIPLAADQSVFTPEEAKAMCSSGAVSLVTVGLHETGGISGFRKVASIAEAFNINVCLHGVFETGITTCASIQAAATISNLDDGNQIMWQLLEEDIIENPDLKPKSGKISVFSGPGLGFDLNHDAVSRAQEEHRKQYG